MKLLILVSKRDRYRKIQRNSVKDDQVGCDDDENGRQNISDLNLYWDRVRN